MFPTNGCTFFYDVLLRHRSNVGSSARRDPRVPVHFFEEVAAVASRMDRPARSVDVREVGLGELVAPASPTASFVAPARRGARQSTTAPVEADEPRAVRRRSELGEPVDGVDLVKYAPPTCTSLLHMDNDIVANDQLFVQLVVQQINNNYAPNQIQWYAHICEQFLNLHVGLSLDFVFCICLGLQLLCF